MAHKCYQVSDATATGDTTKTSIGTITLNARATKVLGIWGYACGAATMTSGEPVTGILEVETPDLGTFQPCQVPLTPIDILTSGTTSAPIQVWPVDIPVKGQERLTGYMTMDMAMTGALKGRWGVVVEVPD